MTRSRPEAPSLDRKRYFVWLNDDRRIASFHPVADYRLISFHSHDSFLNFLQGLQSDGFRFQ